MKLVNVKKLIMLTIFVTCVTITLVGCENGNIKVNTLDSETRNESKASGDEELISKEEVFKEENEEVYKYNESGKIIIIMYHRFAEEEKDEWTRSFDNFYEDLLYLYEYGYRTISLSDYINNNIKVPVGCTPIIFTFDDGTKGQFSFIEGEEGDLVVNPKSAVGIMEKFCEEYPEFGLNGTFYINQSEYFGTLGTRKEKLQYLLDKGFEIGNHTCTHIDFSKVVDPENIIEEVGALSNEVYELTGYKINSLALPFGLMSKTYEENIIKGVFEGIEYDNKALLLVGANPALGPNNEKLNPMRLPRVRARGGNKEVQYDLYWWLERMEKNPEMKYYRLDNDESTNTKN